MKKICEIARQYSVPVFIHQGLSKKSSDMSFIVREFRDVSFIIAHGGVQHFHEVISLARRHNNIFIDTSSYFVTVSKLTRLLKTLGAGRLIFGSDIPVMCRNIREALGKLERLNLPASDLDKILRTNLLGILESRINR